MSHTERAGKTTTSDMFFRVFCAFDYSTSSEDIKKVISRKRIINRSIKAELYETKFEEERAGISKNRLIFIRFLTWVFSFTVLSGSAYLIFFATKTSQTWLAENKGQESKSPIQELGYTYMPSFVILGLNFIWPIVFNIIRVQNFEKHYERTILNITLIRVILIRYATLIVLVISLWIGFTCENWSFSFTNNYVQECDFCDGSECWESKFGEEMYRLVLSTGIAMFTRLFIMEYFIKYLVEKYDIENEFVKNLLIFNVIYNVMEVCYLQVLTWMGTFFCPVLPVITTVIMFFNFYAKIDSTVKNLVSEDKQAFHYSKNAGFFFLVLSAGLFISTNILLYFLTEVTPSRFCGPWRFRYENSMWDVSVKKSINKVDVEFVKKSLIFFGSTMGSITVFFILLAIVVSIWRAGRARKDLARVYQRKVDIYYSKQL